jgi:hypothetical protein
LKFKAEIEAKEVENQAKISSINEEHQKLLNSLKDQKNAYELQV